MRNVEAERHQAEMVGLFAREFARPTKEGTDALECQHELGRRRFGWQSAEEMRAAAFGLARQRHNAGRCLGCTPESCGGGLCGRRPA